MGLDELFAALYPAVNGNRIRRTAAAFSGGAESVSEVFQENGLETEFIAPGTVSALLRGEREECFFLTARDPVLGAAVLLECAAALKTRIDSGKIPLPEYSICFFCFADETLFSGRAGTPQKMTKNSRGGLSLLMEEPGEKARFFLFQPLHIHPSPQHALAAKGMKLAAQICAIDCETAEGSRNEDELPQDLFWGAPWSLLCGTWQKSDDMLPAPAFLKTAAVAGAFTAYCMSAGKNLAEEDLLKCCCAFWKENLHRKCFEALKLKDGDFNARMLRGMRLSAWRDLALDSAACAIGENCFFDDFKEFAHKECAAALQLLCGGEDLPALRSEENGEIIECTLPCRQWLELLPENAGGSAFSCCYFDGKRTVFEAARSLWASRSYGEHESWDEFDKELLICADMAEKAVAKGMAVYKKTPCVTIDGIKKALRELQIRAGDMLMVHAGYKAFGSVENGPQGLIQALQESVTNAGILAMPAFCDCCDGGSGGDYDKETTPVSKKIGIVPELFRQTPGVLRSEHPTHSLCAWGDDALNFLKQNETYDCFAPDGPWGKIAAGGKILFLGESAVASNTFLHACEAWYPGYLDSIEAVVHKKKVRVSNYPGGCRGSWYGKGRRAEWYLKLKERNIVHEVWAGKALLTLFEGKELAAAMKEIFEKEPALLLHKSGCRECARIRSRIK